MLKLHLSLTRFVHRWASGRERLDGKVLALFRGERAQVIPEFQRRIIEGIRGENWQLAPIIQRLEESGDLEWVPLDQDADRELFLQWLDGLNAFLARRSLPQLPQPAQEPDKWEKWVAEQLESLGVAIEVVL